MATESENKMKKLYVCPHCQSEDVQIDGYEDGGGDYGEDLTAVFICNDCAYGFSEDEGFWGYEGGLEELPMDNKDGNPFRNPQDTSYASDQ